MKAMATPTDPFLSLVRYNAPTTKRKMHSGRRHAGVADDSAHLLWFLELESSAIWRSLRDKQGTLASALVCVLFREQHGQWPPARDNLVWAVTR